MSSDLQPNISKKLEISFQNLNNNVDFVKKNIFFGDKKIPVRSKMNYEDQDSTNIARISNIIHSIGSRTKAGFNGYSMKTNQDSFIYNKILMGDGEKSFLSVFDGHGQNGHKVSQYLKLHTIELLIKKLKSHYAGNNTIKSSTSEISDKDIANLLKEVFVETNRNLNSKLPRHTELSGSTGVSVFICNKKIYCANLGDSEAAVLVNTSNGWELRKVCRCHLPTEEDEINRIMEAGGHIEAIKLPNGEHIGPPRIWLKNSNMPGLMMSRTFGDRVGHLCGITDVPEIMIEELSNKHACLVLGSDGLFEG